MDVNMYLERRRKRRTNKTPQSTPLLAAAVVAGVECCGGGTDKCTPTAVVSKVMSVHLVRV